MMKTQFCAATRLDGFIATEDEALDGLFPSGEPGRLCHFAGRVSEWRYPITALTRRGPRHPMPGCACRRALRKEHADGC